MALLAKRQGRMSAGIEKKNFQKRPSKPAEDAADKSDVF
jgi:hypothetical protein